ncbi:c-type cytochrome [Massilia sp. DWR3-1-1]|uniref:c-type cytochrome n=1 Tax=Massilia sp. DWR3-1-1 TaxID=2804559 RepID=UPI003CFA01CE
MKRAVLMWGLAAAAVQARAEPAAVDGKTVFAKNCAACHQATGAGIPGAFPALKANPFLQGEPVALITTVLKGRAGMPAFAASLDDAQLAAVLSYARGAWGNQAAPISPAQTAAVREAANAPASTQQKSTIIH